MLAEPLDQPYPAENERGRCRISNSLKLPLSPRFAALVYLSNEYGKPASMRPKHSLLNFHLQSTVGKRKEAMFS